MNPRVLRILIPLAVAGLATLVVLSMLLPKPQPQQATPGPSAVNQPPASQPASPSAGLAGGSAPTATAPTATTPSTQPIAGLRAVTTPPAATGGAAWNAQSLGSIDPRIAQMQVQMTRESAGIAA